MTQKPTDGTWRGKLRLQLQVDQWPPGDQRCWQEATTRHSILDPGGAASQWSRGTRRSVEKGYGRWLAWLISKSQLDPTASPSARVTVERVAAYVDDLRKASASTTVWSYVHSLAMTVDVLAPGADTQWLWKAVSVLKRSVTPTGRKRGRVMPSSELMAFGGEMMDEAENAPGPSQVKAAARFRDGLMIALLAARPLRIRNFVSIEIGTQLMRQSQGYSLRFEVDETKTRQEIELPFPANLVGRLDTYLTVFRPVLLRQHGRVEASMEMDHPGSALWVTEWGTKMSEPTMHARIVDLTRKKFGKSVNPHLFRDCAATSIALTDPDNVAITVQVLGHKTLATSERFYNHAMSRKASETYQTQIAKMRREAAREACRTPTRDRCS